MEELELPIMEGANGKRYSIKGTPDLHIAVCATCNRRFVPIFTRRCEPRFPTWAMPLSKSAMQVCCRCAAGVLRVLGRRIQNAVQAHRLAVRSELLRLCNA